MVVQRQVPLHAVTSETSSFSFRPSHVATGYAAPVEGRLGGASRRGEGQNDNEREVVGRTLGGVEVCGGRDVDGREDGAREVDWREDGARAVLEGLRADGDFGAASFRTAARCVMTSLKGCFAPLTGCTE